MRSLLSVLLCLILFAGAFAQGKKQRTSSSVRKEQSDLKKEIGKTQKNIALNKDKTRKRLNELNSLNSEIQLVNDTIARLNREINRLNIREQGLNDSISKTENEIATLKKECGRSLRDSRKRRRSLSEMNLIFSASSFNQAMKRTGYINQLNKLMTSKAMTLKQLQDSLVGKVQVLNKIKDQQQTLLASLVDQNHKLSIKQTETTNLVAELEQEAASLAAVLEDQQHKAQRLDNELKRIIEEEARIEEQRRKEEERRLAELRRKEEEQRLAQQQQQQQQNSNKDVAQKAKTPATSAANNASSSSNSKDKKIASTTPITEVSKALTGNFSSNKGNLLFPVGGKYKIISTFGVHNHENLPYVKTENAGIDIEATPGSNARAVFDGTVSSIFYLDGFYNIVMVRHGEYLTVYTNIDKLSVKKGDKVKSGQQLGHIFSDTNDSNRTILHFEIRKETQKLNPLEWVKK